MVDPRQRMRQAFPAIKFAAVQLKVRLNQSLPSLTTIVVPTPRTAHLRRRHAQNGGKAAASTQVREPFGSLE
ncbi:hypothetical protein GUG62_01910 [Xanthomonas citri pv. citri]|nr:hypothetical protein [Xanthomonas citri pv. citri]